MTKEKNITFENIIKNIKKKKRKNAILNLEENKIKNFSTGSLIIDSLTNSNGYPFNRITEIFGQPSTGKTTLALLAIKEIQKISKKKIIFFDIERTLNLDYVDKLGINLKQLIVLRPKNAEETFDLMISFLETKEVSLIILDSVAALLPQSEEEHNMESQTIGLQARIMSKALRKINHLLTEVEANIIFTNQIREKIKTFFGNPEITSGGNALKFYASLRIELRWKEKIIENKKEVGNVIKVKIVKNKLGIPFKIDYISIFFNEGIRLEHEVFELSLKNELIKKKGNYFWYNDIKLGLGLLKTKKFLQKNIKILNELKNKLNN